MTPTGTRPSQPAAQPEYRSQRIRCHCNRGYVADPNREATRCRACDGQGYKWVRVLLLKDAA